jgi:hypothetical protein
MSRIDSNRCDKYRPRPPPLKGWSRRLISRRSLPSRFLRNVRVNPARGPHPNSRFFSRPCELVACKKTSPPRSGVNTDHSYCAREHLQSSSQARFMLNPRPFDHKQTELSRELNRTAPPLGHSVNLLCDTSPTPFARSKINYIKIEPLPSVGDLSGHEGRLNARIRSDARPRTSAGSR